jgi:hypothetical protein
MNVSWRMLCDKAEDFVTYKNRELKYRLPKPGNARLTRPIFWRYLNEGSVFWACYLVIMLHISLSSHFVT